MSDGAVADYPRGIEPSYADGERRRLLQPPKNSPPSYTDTNGTLKASSSSSSSPEADKTDKQKYLEFAVYSLKFMLIVFLVSVIVATFLTIFYEMNESYMPLWLIFTVLWVGHAVIVGVSVRVVQLLFRSLIPGYEKDKLTNKVLRTNEKRIALAQFTLFNLLWVHGFAFMCIIFEVLLFIALLGITPAYACLIPVYIVAAVAIINALVCRTTPFSSGLSWICILVFCILCNLKINETADLSWTIVFIPIFVLLVLWLGIFMYVLCMMTSNTIILTKHQTEAVVLYLFAAIGGIVSLGFFVLPESAEEEGAHSVNAQIGTGILLVGEILFCIGVVKSADATIGIAIDRMGSDRPQNLVRSEEGWEVDTTKSFEQYPFIGEVETTRTVGCTTDDGLQLPFCGCCVNLTVADLLCRDSRGDSRDASRSQTPTNDGNSNISRSGSRNDFESLA